MTSEFVLGEKVAVESEIQETFVGVIEDIRPYPCDPYWWGYTVSGVRCLGCQLRQMKKGS